MKYLCTNCNYVFDNALGDVEELVGIGDELVECPVCGEYDTFQGIEEEVNYIDNDLGVLEIDHYPEVEIIGNKLKVTVGNEIHPMGENHRIAAVYLFDEYGDQIDVKYLELDIEPVVEFDYDNLGEFEIRVKCSIHGLWGKKISE